MTEVTTRVPLSGLPVGTHGQIIEELPKWTNPKKHRPAHTVTALTCRFKVGDRFITRMVSPKDVLRLID